MNDDRNRFDGLHTDRRIVIFKELPAFGDVGCSGVGQESEEHKQVLEIKSSICLVFHL